MCRSCYTRRWNPKDAIFLIKRLCAEMVKTMKRWMRVLGVALLVTGLLAGCGTPKPDGEGAPDTENTGDTESSLMDSSVVDEAVSFTHVLDDYKPKKKEYNFYFTYKMVKPWWDAVAMGLEDATDQYAAKGITINYEYLAPTSPSAADQKNRILAAAKCGYDVIGVDVVDSAKIAPVIDKVIGQGQKVITFASSDTDPSEHCKRIAYVGNTHNRQDGADLAMALCERINFKGKVGIIVGDPRTPCHEERLAGAKSVLKKYKDIEIIGIDYDRESLIQAQIITEKYLSKSPDLAGIICLNMINPVGAARAVKMHNLSNQVTIVGMDHDEHALKLMQVGGIYCLAVQDCCSIGFDTIQVAIKVADGVKPGKLYKKKTREKTTLIYQRDAAAMLYKLYGEE